MCSRRGPRVRLWFGAATATAAARRALGLETTLICRSMPCRLRPLCKRLACASASPFPASHFPCLCRTGMGYYLDAAETTRATKASKQRQRAEAAAARKAAAAAQQQAGHDSDDEGHMRPVPVRVVLHMTCAPLCATSAGLPCLPACCHGVSVRRVLLLLCRRLEPSSGTRPPCLADFQGPHHRSSLACHVTCRPA